MCKKIFKITEDFWNNRLDNCIYADLYINTGVRAFVDTLNEKNYNINNFRVNRATFDKIHDFLLENLLKSKKYKYTKLGTVEYRRKRFSWDCLGWAPNINNDLNNDEIEVLLKNHPNFVEAIIN